MENTKPNNLTFTEFNNLIDRWITDTLDIQGVFANQAEFLKQCCLQKENNEYRLRQINGWINILYFHQSRLEADLGTVLQNLANIQNCLNNLESRPSPNIEDIRKVDPSWARFYDLLDGVCSSMGRWREFSDIYCRGICQVERETLTDPAEQLAKIMMCELQTLEELEVKLYQMMTSIVNLETQKNLILGRGKNGFVSKNVIA